MYLTREFYAYAAGAFLALMIIELAAGSFLKRKIHLAGDTWANLSIYGGYIAMAGLYGIAAFFIFDSVERFAPFHPGDSWPAWAALFILEDFCFYWFHRTSHRVRFFWASHVVHHSSEQFNLTVALRQSWIPFFGVLFWTPLAFLGFSPFMILTVQTISLLYQALMHTQLVDLPRSWGLVLNSPSNHRVHHGTNREYVDRNFGGIFIVWDRIFRTFEPEVAKPVFGISPAQKNDDPFYIQFHEWGSMLLEILTLRRFRWEARVGSSGPMRRAFTSFVLLAVGLGALIQPQWFLTLGCAAAMRDAQKEHILGNLAKVRSYAGTYRETGSLLEPSAIETKIVYEAASQKFRAEVISPGKDQGSVFVYDGKSYAVYYPSTGYGLKFLNVETPALADQIAFFNKEYDWHLQNYEARVAGRGKVAGREALNIVYKPISPRKYLYQWTSHVDEEYSLMLRTEMQQGQATAYQFEFKEIQFNRLFPENTFAYEFPAGAVVGVWDLASADIPLARAKVMANFPLTLPDRTFRGTALELRRTIRTAGVVPGFMAIYKNGPYYLYYSQIRDYGLALVPSRGIRIDGRRLYRVSFAGGVKTIQFLESGVYNTLVTNLPLTDVMEAVDTHL